MVLTFRLGEVATNAMSVQHPLQSGFFLKMCHFFSMQRLQASKPAVGREIKHFYGPQTESHLVENFVKEWKRRGIFQN